MGGNSMAIRERPASAKLLSAEQASAVMAELAEVRSAAHRMRVLCGSRVCNCGLTTWFVAALSAGEAADRGRARGARRPAAHLHLRALKAGEPAHGGGGRLPCADQAA